MCLNYFNWKNDEIFPVWPSCCEQTVAFHWTHSVSTHAYIIYLYPRFRPRLASRYAEFIHTVYTLHAVFRWFNVPSLSPITTEYLHIRRCVWNRVWLTEAFIAISYFRSVYAKCQIYPIYLFIYLYHAFPCFSPFSLSPLSLPPRPLSLSLSTGC